MGVFLKKNRPCPLYLVYTANRGQKRPVTLSLYLTKGNNAPDLETSGTAIRLCKFTHFYLSEPLDFAREWAMYTLVTASGSRLHPLPDSKRRTDVLRCRKDRIRRGFALKTRLPTWEE